MFCQKCGTEVPDEVSVCTNCGCPTGDTPKPQNQSKVKKPIPRKVVVLSIIGVLVLIPALYFLIYHIQCMDISSQERVAMRICREDGDFSGVKYANFLKTANNGYCDYDYYDVCDNSGNHYIVELRNGNEYYSGYPYSDFIDRYVRLNDTIKFRSTELGSLGDAIEYSGNKIHEYNKWN